MTHGVLIGEKNVVQRSFQKWKSHHMAMFFLRQYYFDLKTLHALVSRPRSMMHTIVMSNATGRPKMNTWHWQYNSSPQGMVTLHPTSLSFILQLQWQEYSETTSGKARQLEGCGSDLSYEMLWFDEKLSFFRILFGILAAHRAIIKANSHAIETGIMMRIIVPKTRSSVPNP